ncbi:hypothetical protein Taro_042836 [Colocasia esculenta]|uniref:Uncharacterized protein n=1 Tax=Colocasia esculenta TaxID=4460 RepID=A0A843WXI3_COLES|nr:hypothetical protein [Colocasia esculenta]
MAELAWPRPWPNWLILVFAELMSSAQVMPERRFRPRYHVGPDDLGHVSLDDAGAQIWAVHTPGGGQQMNLLVNIAPYGHMRPENSTFESTCSFSLTQPTGTCIISSKVGSIGSELYLPSGDLSMTGCTLHHDLDRLLPFKSTTAQVLNQGTEASADASNLDGAPDFRRALSLLSTDSWGSAAHPGSTPINQLVHENRAASAQTALHPNSNYWQPEQSMPHETRAAPFPLHSDGSQFQGFQLLKEPCGAAFFSSSRMN